MYDKQFGTTDYFTHVLAVFEFFRLGSSVQMSRTADPTAETAADPSTHWSQVVAKTVEIVQMPDFLAAKPQASLEAHARAASSILAVNGTPQAPIDAVAGELKKRILKPTDPWANNSAATNFESLGQQVWVAWDNQQDSFTKAVRAAIIRVRNEQKRSLTDTVGDNPPLEKTTDEAVHGDDIVAFVKANQDLFNGVPDDGKRTVVTGTDIDVAHPSSCFRPGTLVLTPTGSTAIEELREGDMVVTLGGKNSQSGRCSDEVVRTSTVPPRGQSRCQLWGFNGKREFFTAGHVFHTTTGLRALDPHAALVENPWLEVGYLKVGHSVLHTLDGKSYQPVTITSLSFQLADCEWVYGVHLREGLRSYHANGFLVHLNYPEITARSLSQLLVRMSPSDQVDMLYHVKELRPLLQRFGAETIADVMQQELRQRTTSGLSLFAQSPASTTLRLRGLQHLKRRWSLTDDYRESEKPDFGERLDSLAVFEGVLNVGGTYCPRASISTRQIVWSRQIRAQEWEHGVCKFNDDMTMGFGFICYSNDEDPTDAGSKRFMCANTIPTIGRESPLHDKTTATGVVRQLARASQKSDVPHGATSPPIKTREAIAAADPKDASADFPPAQDVPLAQLQPLDQIDEWTISVDTDTNPTSLFDIYTALDGDRWTARIPLLDDLANKMFTSVQTRLGSLATISEFYHVWQELDIDGRPTFQFEMTGAETIAAFADGYDSSSPKYQDLTFTFPDGNVHIPFIFSSMSLTMTSDGDSGDGVIREYDPTCVETLGKRRAINAQPAASIESVQSMRVRTSATTVGSAAGAHPDLMRKTHLAPHAGVMRLASTASAMPNDIVARAKTLTGLKMDNSSITTTSNQMFDLAVRYHMTDEQCHNFQGSNRPAEGNGDPTNVPLNLASNLDPTLIQWLKSTYIPAFMAQRIADTPPDTRKAWRVDLNDQQRAKIQYWFKGKGDSCMSLDPNFTELNKITAAEAMSVIYPEIAKVSGAGGAADLAREVFTLATTSQSLDEMARGSSATVRIRIEAAGAFQLTKSRTDEQSPTILRQS